MLRKVFIRASTLRYYAASVAANDAAAAERRE
jgi:hypothetical protein